MADPDSPATWEMGVPRSEGYVIELHRLIRRLRYPRFPIYRVRQCGSVWEARVEVHTRVPSELDYSFPTRHRRDLPEIAMQDAAREAFLRLSSIHRAELASTEFAHHPFREEGNSVCTVQDTPCCYSPIMTRLSRWAEAVDDFYEEALLEIDDQQRRVVSLPYPRNKRGPLSLPYPHSQKQKGTGRPSGEAAAEDPTALGRGGSGGSAVPHPPPPSFFPPPPSLIFSIWCVAQCAVHGGGEEGLTACRCGRLLEVGVDRIRRRPPTPRASTGRRPHRFKHRPPPPPLRSGDAGSSLLEVGGRQIRHWTAFSSSVPKRPPPRASHLLLHPRAATAIASSTIPKY
uniref:Cell wall protein-like n=1 Tax=Oryza sativa subsp. japonica TaxID=39947 RepID=Q6K758_ORYSJ|nr:cell wall protein-like [Oryza sativa Japonica Group]